MSAESCKSKNCTDSKKVELMKKIKIMIIMDKILIATRPSPPTPRTWRRRPQVLCGSVKKCAKCFVRLVADFTLCAEESTFSVRVSCLPPGHLVATSTATSAVTRARLFRLEYKKRELTRVLGSYLWIVK